MPFRPGIGQANIGAVFLAGGDDENFRVTRERRLIGRVLIQRTKASGKGNLLFGCQCLVTEYHDKVVQMGPMDAGEIIGIQRSGQIDPDDFGAKTGRKRTDFK